MQTHRTIVVNGIGGIDLDVIRLASVAHDRGVEPAIHVCARTVKAALDDVVNRACEAEFNRVALGGGYRRGLVDIAARADLDDLVGRKRGRCKRGSEEGAGEHGGHYLVGEGK